MKMSDREFADTRAKEEGFENAEQRNAFYRAKWFTEHPTVPDNATPEVKRLREEVRAVKGEVEEIKRRTRMWWKIFGASIVIGIVLYFGYWAYINTLISSGPLVLRIKVAIAAGAKTKEQS